MNLTVEQDQYTKISCTSTYKQWKKISEVRQKSHLQFINTWNTYECILWKEYKIFTVKKHKRLLREVKGSGRGGGGKGDQDGEYM